MPATARSLIIALTGAALLAPAHRAPAQDALGDGTALDANLRVGSGGRNPAGRSLESELAFRNAIVTGNAPGGMSFRGEVGYTAASDFRGALGSDDIFSFQRETYFNSLATRNLSGIDALRTTMSYSIAGQSGDVYGQSLIINRGGGATGADLDPAAPAVRFDPFGNVEGALRSPSVHSVRATDLPTFLARAATGEDGTETMVMSASDLLGVRTLPGDNPLITGVDLEPPTPGLGPELPGTPGVPGTEGDDDATARGEDEDDEPRMGVVESMRVELERRGRPVGEPVRGGTDDDPAIDEDDGDAASPQRFDPFDADAADPAAPPEDGDAEGDEDAEPSRLDRLRQLLRPDTSFDPAPRDEPGDTEGAGDEGGEMTRAEEVMELARQLFTEELPPIGTLQPRPGSGEVFERHMERGQSLLVAGRYFSAEERFTAALGVVPGDPLAAAGRVLAQLGAGMYRSAAHNLRNLFRAYPELIGAGLDESLLPAADRRAVIALQLRERIGDSIPAVATDAGLLLAFLGRISDDPAMTAEGFDVVEGIGAADEAEPDPLIAALRAAWLENTPE